MVSCHFSERHFTLIHSHKLSNRIYLLHELSLFIFSILHPFSAEDWLLEKTFISELRKTRACQNTSSVCCNRPYIRIYWNVIQLFTLNELVNGEFHSLILSIPYRRYVLHYLKQKASQTMPTVRCFLGFLHHETRFPVLSKRNKPTLYVHWQEFKNFPIVVT